MQKKIFCYFFAFQTLSLSHFRPACAGHQLPSTWNKSEVYMESGDVISFTMFMFVALKCMHKVLYNQLIDGYVSGLFLQSKCSSKQAQQNSIVIFHVHIAQCLPTQCHRSANYAINIDSGVARVAIKPSYLLKQVILLTKLLAHHVLHKYRAPAWNHRDQVDDKSHFCFNYVFVIIDNVVTD